MADDVARAQVVILKRLLYEVRFGDPRAYIPTQALQETLESVGESRDVQWLRSTVIAQLRDAGVLISSSPQGYKRPVAIADVGDFVAVTDTVVHPMLNRTARARDAVLMYIAGLLRAAVLRRAGEDADRIAERVTARMAEVTGATTVKMAITGDRIAATAMATLPTGMPVAMTPGVVRSVPMARASTPISVLDEPAPILLTTTMAAKLLGCSLKALYHRVAERQIPSSCVVPACPRPGGSTSCATRSARTWPTLGCPQ